MTKDLLRADRGRSLPGLRAVAHRIGVPDAWRSDPSRGPGNQDRDSTVELKGGTDRHQRPGLPAVQSIVAMIRSLMT